MREISILKDAAFLKKLDVENIRVQYVKIIVLDKNEKPLRAIEGRVSTGSISINGKSAVRRAGSFTFLAEETKNDLTDIDNLLSMNKRIKILVGLENHIDKNYDDIIWFPQGIFIITNPSLSHTTGGVTINIQFKDKMCLLNGENGGILPTSITFDSYDQVIGLERNLLDFPSNPNTYTVYQIKDKYYMWDTLNGWYESSLFKVNTVISVKQKIFDIIQTLVVNYGGESLNKIIVNDVPTEIKNAVRYVGQNTLYYDPATSLYTTNEDAIDTSKCYTFNYNEECGYVYTDFTYPGSLVSAIGESVTSVLDKIKNALGNFEYFYDINGNFVFQEIKNYLNNTYNPITKTEQKYRLTTNGIILSEANYIMDLSNQNKSVYTFEEGSTLISSYSNTPNYNNIKNDFHIWGKSDKDLAIHYHIAVKEKPIKQERYEGYEECTFPKWNVVFLTNSDNSFNGKLRLAEEGEEYEEYIPDDWRAELYLEGLQKLKFQQRPDIYEQELLDMFDSIYNMKEKRFLTEADNPSRLNYWIDYISSPELYNISVDTIGTKIYSYQNDEIKRLYNRDIPDTIIINEAFSQEEQKRIIDKCFASNQNFSRISKKIFNNLSLGSYGLTAQDNARELINQYTDFNSTISLSSIPIFYLEANSRITVQDKASGIYGDYVINSIKLPLNAKGNMTISATRAIDRI